LAEKKEIFAKKRVMSRCLAQGGGNGKGSQGGAFSKVSTSRKEIFGKRRNSVPRRRNSSRGRGVVLVLAKDCEIEKKGKRGKKGRLNEKKRH